MDWQSFQERQSAAFSQVVNGLGGHRVEFHTAGKLAALIARLPADTPVIIAETARVDPRVDLDSTRSRTIIMAEVVPLGDPDNIIDIDDGGQLREQMAITPAVRLGSVIVSEDAPGMPHSTVPFPAYERAVEALGDADLTAALDAQLQLLNWMASTLATNSDRDDEGEEGVADSPDTFPKWIDDPDLRAALAVEADRLRHAAALLTALRARLAEYEAVAEVTAAAEEIVQIAAEYPDPDDDRPGSAT